jgi:hypothetical protein
MNPPLGHERSLSGSRDAIPVAVTSAFVAGEEAEQGEWRSVCRRHDTEGGILLLLRDTLPKAARWKGAEGIRVDVLNSAPDTYAPVATRFARLGVRVGRVTEWQLMNALRSRSVPCAGDS